MFEFFKLHHYSTGKTLNILRIGEYKLLINASNTWMFGIQRANKYVVYNAIHLGYVSIWWA